MQDFTRYPIGSEEYWNGRASETKDFDDMIFLDKDREKYWEHVRNQLSLWNNLRVLDVCCGWGRFSKGFPADKYTGIDFSQKMIEHAMNKNPDKRFATFDIRKVIPSEHFDVIFEVNSLHSLGMEPEKFHNIFKGKAPIIACLERDRYVIYYDW